LNLRVFVVKNILMASRKTRSAPPLSRGRKPGNRDCVWGRWTALPFFARQFSKAGKAPPLRRAVGPRGPANTRSPGKKTRARPLPGRSASRKAGVFSAIGTLSKRFYRVIPGAPVPQSAPPRRGQRPFFSLTHQSFKKNFFSNRSNQSTTKS